MKRILLILALLPAAVSPAAQPRSVVMTLQENGQAQISETHVLPPPDDAGQVRIEPLPETLLPGSVNAVPIERGETVDILSQRFAYDLLNDTTLFRAFRDQEINCLKGDHSFSGKLAALPDFQSRTPSLALTLPNRSVRVIPDLFSLDAVEFPALPGLARTPTLLWKPAGGESLPAAVQLHYAAAGLPWSAFHEAVLSETRRSMALSTRICLKNQTTRDFANARIRLALTEKGQYAPLVPDREDPRAGTSPMLQYSSDGKSWIPERSAASACVIATYDLPHPVTLPAGSETYATLYTSPSIDVITDYIYDGVRFDRFRRSRRTDPNLGTESSSGIETLLTFKNQKTTALPPGTFRLLCGEADHALEWIGTAWLPPLHPGEAVTLQLGPASGLSGQRIRTAYTEVDPLHVAEESFEITLQNQTPADQVITVVEHLYRGDQAEIISASAEHTPGNAPQTIEFAIPVKAGSEQSFTYTVRYTW